jgi:outer membrane protein insertion porin family
LANWIRAWLVGVVVVVASVVPGQVEAQSGDVVREVAVEGTQRIEPETVRSYLLIREGDRFDPDRVNRSLKSLFATGLFADVTLRRQGDRLVVSVVENPIINRIAFEGNRRIKNEALEQEVTLRPRVVYTRSKVQADVARILTVYRRSGRFAANVEPKVIQLPQNRVDVVFEISEGEQSEIASIRFLGNREFSDGTLREVIRTRETAWYRVFTTDDRYDPDRLTLDRELLRRHYLRKGYADFRVVSAVAEMSPDRRQFFVTFTVDEGARYEFGEIDVEIRLPNLDGEQVMEVIEIEPGDWYDAELIDESIDKIIDVVGTLGYAFVEVRPRVNRDRETRKIDVTFEVDEGPRVFVERIDIAGNVRTVDEVIRREFRLVEGDAFNSSKLARSRQRIRNLGFFSKVDVEQVPGSGPDQTVINVQVEEKSTGSIAFGAGYSTASGVLGDVTLRERNLLGRGYDFKLGLTLAARRSAVDFSLTDPFFLGREIAAGVDIFWTSQDLQESSSYDLNTTGFALRAGYPLSEPLRQDWKYTLKQTEVTEVDDDASRFIKEAEGKETLSSLTHILTYDRRDSVITPTEGYFARLTTEGAGIGGSKQFFRNRVDAGKYYSVADDWVLEFTGSAGTIVGLGKDVDLTDRYFIGGESVRGFESGGLGPRDTDAGDSLGGEWMYHGTVQLSFPFGLPQELKIGGRIFTDFGSSGSVEPAGPEVADTNSIRVSSGFGVSWFSPFGPIGLDFGFPIVKEDFDQTETLRVNFGTRF